jgi:hypothetical protein
MAGSFPQGREFNVFIDSVASNMSLKTGRVSGIYRFRIGKEILTGLE